MPESGKVCPVCGNEVDADGIHDHVGRAEHDRVMDIEAARSAVHASIESARREVLAAVQAVTVLGGESLYDVEVAEGGVRDRVVAALGGVDVTLAGVAAQVPEPGLPAKVR